MKVVINGKFLTEKITGIQRYALEITRALDDLLGKEQTVHQESLPSTIANRGGALEKDRDIELLVPKNCQTDLSWLRHIRVVRYGKSGGQVWEQICLPVYLLRHRAIGIHLCNVVPLLYPKGIACIHDINYKVNPQYFRVLHARISRIWHVLQYRVITHRTKTIITVSAFSKREIMKYYHVSSARITVIPNAWQHFVRSVPAEALFTHFPMLKKKQYFFSLSSLAPNKNLRWILEAARRNPQETFAIAGMLDPKRLGETFADAALPNVHYLGYVTDDEAKILMKNCKAFLFPTLYEGFGIPPMEALSMGADCIVSKCTSLPEIYGDAVSYIDPYIYELSYTPKSADVKEQRLGLYSWEKSAKKLHCLIFGEKDTLQGKQQKKTILMIGDSIYPDTMGGSHRVIYEFSKRLVQKGYRVIAFSPKPSENARSKEIIDGIEIYRYPREKENKVKAVRDFLLGPEQVYKKLFSEHAPDIVHAHWPLTSYRILRSLRKNKKVKKLYTFHGPACEEYQLELAGNRFIKQAFVSFVRYLESRCLKYSDHILAHSEYMKKKEIRLYGNERKISRLYLRVDTDFFAPKFRTREEAKADLHLDINDSYLFCVRRLKKRMGIDNLIRAFAAVASKYSRVQLIIGGKGDYQTELEQICLDCGIRDRVIFTGFIPDEKLPVYYQACTLSVTPSLDLEGFGLVTCEAMSCGCPVVATDVCANPELLNGIAPGLLAKGTDAEALSKAILHALDNREYYAGLDYRQYVIQHFSWKQSFAEIEKYYL